MTKTKNFLNNIFLYFTICSIIFICTNYYFRNFYKSISISIIITTVIYFLISILIKKKNDFNLIKSKDLKTINYLKEQFLFFNNNELFNYLKQILNIDYKNEININNVNYLIFQTLNKTTTQKEDIIKILNKAKNNLNIILFCQNTDDKVDTFIKDLEHKIIIIKLNDLYLKVIKEKNIFPKEKVKISLNNKKNFKELIKIAINKTNSKKYFIFGLTTLFLSFFTYFNIYYIVFSTILFLLSIISYFNKSKIKFKETNSILNNLK